MVDKKSNSKKTKASSNIDSKKNKIESKKSDAKKSINYWIFSTGILLILLIVSLIFNMGQSSSVANTDEVGEKVVSFLNSETGGGVELVSSNLENDLIEVVVSYQENVFPFYVTSDGKTLIIDHAPLDAPVAQQNQPQGTLSYTNEEIQEIKQFNDCLAENGLVIYGSYSCPHCTSLVSMLGGNLAVESLYVECTQDSERCSDEKIEAYVPEIQINGQLYEGQRTFGGFSSATGCPAPKI